MITIEDNEKCGGRFQALNQPFEALRERCMKTSCRYWRKRVCKRNISDDFETILSLCWVHSKSKSNFTANEIECKFRRVSHFSTSSREVFIHYFTGQVCKVHEQDLFVLLWIENIEIVDYWVLDWTQFVYIPSLWVKLLDLVHSHKAFQQDGIVMKLSKLRTEIIQLIVIANKLSWLFKRIFIGIRAIATL